jgi:RimJ/RimL family protein N-acetyltransferase
MQLFETENLIFREMGSNDITAEMVADLNNKNHMKYSNNCFLDHSVSLQHQYLESFVNSSNQYVGGFLRETSVLAVKLIFLINVHHLTADVSSLVRPASAGKKIGYEAYDASVRFLFEAYDMRKITGGTLKTNLKMLKIFERLGFELEGVRKKQASVGSQEVDKLLFWKFNV